MHCRPLHKQTGGRQDVTEQLSHALHREVIGCEGGTLMIGLVPLKKGQERNDIYHVRPQLKYLSAEQEEGLTRNHLSWQLELRFPSPQSCEK